MSDFAQGGRPPRRDMPGGKGVCAVVCASREKRHALA